MSLFLGIDTSNYTTSTALYDSKTGEMVQQKKLLPVKEGQLGLRQSDAVFHHTAQLHTLIEELLKDGIIDHYEVYKSAGYQFDEISSSGDRVAYLQECSALRVCP